MKTASDFFRLYRKEFPVIGLVLLAGIVLGSLLDSRDRVRMDADQRANANLVAVQTLQEINERLTRKALVLSRLTAAAQVLPELDTVTFEQIARGIAFDASFQSSDDTSRAISVISISYAENGNVSKSCWSAFVLTKTANISSPVPWEKPNAELYACTAACQPFESYL